MESARLHSAMRRDDVRPLRVCDTHNARTAFTNLLFHETSENVRACLCHFSLRAKLDLSAFALARFLIVGRFCKSRTFSRLTQTPTVLPAKSVSICVHLWLIWLHANLGHRRRGFHREKVDAIAHLAARAGVRPSIQLPQLYYDTNVTGTLHLLEAARVTGVERFVFASSSSVYGASKTVPFSEDQHLTQTLSPYGATKVAGEFLCSTYSHLYQMRVVALRYFTVYGPRQRPDLAIHQFARRIYAGQAIDQFGDGSTRRDYTYIGDVIQGTMAALKYEGPRYDIFNLGESETIQLKELISMLENALGKKAKINRLSEQPGDMPLTCADISKARKLLGYNPTMKFSEGLPRFVKWFLSSQRL